MRAALRSLQWPRGIAHERAAHRNEFGIAIRDEGVGFRGIGDAAERGDRGAVYRRAQLAHQRHVRHARAVAVGHVQFE